MKDTIVRLSCDLTLSKNREQSLSNALNHEQTRRKRSKRVLEELRSEEGSGTLFMSPSKIQRARDIADGREAAKAAQKAQKAEQQLDATEFLFRCSQHNDAGERDQAGLTSDAFQAVISSKPEYPCLLPPESAVRDAIKPLRRQHTANGQNFSNAQRQKLHVEFPKHPKDEIFSIASALSPHSPEIGPGTGFASVLFPPYEGTLRTHSVPLCALYLARHTRRALPSFQWQRSRRRNHLAFHFFSKKYRRGLLRNLSPEIAWSTVESIYDAWLGELTKEDTSRHSFAMEMHRQFLRERDFETRQDTAPNNI
ncbi:hypothetical protein M433DRAFT_6836 [Acidomyces richmondensis BFW]|nr:hypothetical protein M433DRAFT_6836 [Acidomyces richmondensis BFW]